MGFELESLEFNASMLTTWLPPPRSLASDVFEDVLKKSEDKKWLRFAANICLLCRDPISAKNEKNLTRRKKRKKGRERKNDIVLICSQG